MKYSIVIVTYNRLELLKEAVAHALSQKMQPSHIVIVNNASTDGTEEYLKALETQYEQIIVKTLSNNTGGAGGFYYGLEMAHTLGDDWHVIIDDDAMLRKDFVSQLYVAIRKYPQLRCVAGAVYTDGEIVTDHRQHMIRPGFRFQKIEKEAYESHAFTCDTASFCGLMIKDDLIDEIGLPEKDYFIWYDDTEYCVRIRKCTQILVITHAILDHKVAVSNEGWPRHYTWKDYYGIRNRICMVRTHGNAMDRIMNRIDMFIRIRIRNTIFQILHMNHEDWKYELDTYKKAVKDAKIR